ncbi:MAG TPA: helix-turn-helix transcriptional regulator [Anaeromyxobacteraceae bacterium]|nr:helix-turn-helix transcriptional regulator [Anaeromyxobacteraceae bacterium]
MAKRVGARVRALREEQGLTLEKLAYESDVGSKGFLSDIEKGLARPTLATLAALAERLEVALLDLVTFPADDERQALVDRSRSAAPELLRKWLKESRVAPVRRTTQR